ncbi:MAG: hypothetical protein AAGK37_05670 [Pseudomonadota bacterium]
MPGRSKDRGGARFCPRLYLAAAALLTTCTAALAVVPTACDRTTHVSHGGETGHRDFGGGRVGYAEWWSQEGVYTDLVIMTCHSGEFLRTRVREERVSERSFDRTEKAIALIARELRAAPELFSFRRLASVLDGTGRDIEIAVADAETCACAAFYPDARGTKTPYAG